MWKERSVKDELIVFLECSGDIALFFFKVFLDTDPDKLSEAFSSIYTTARMCGENMLLFSVPQDAAASAELVYIRIHHFHKKYRSIHGFKMETKRFYCSHKGGIKDLVLLQ